MFYFNSTIPENKNKNKIKLHLANHCNFCGYTQSLRFNSCSTLISKALFFGMDGWMDFYKLNIYHKSSEK